MNRDDLAALELRVKALIKAYWRLRSYAVHDDGCKLNKPPRFQGPCSCGLMAAIKAGERAADLLEVAEDGPTEYERKVAQPQGVLMIEAIAQQAARDARDVFSEHPVAKEAVDYMEQLIYAAIRAEAAKAAAQADYESRILAALEVVE